LNSPVDRAWVIETIRNAERSIARADYRKALEILHSVRRVEPSNMYVFAIIERVETLMRGSLQTASDLQDMVDSTRPGNGTGQYLSITVGENAETDASLATVPEDAADAESKIKRFTEVAAHLYERGSYELAFESLMNAYLIDPTSPLVSECEKKLLPAFEALKSQGGARRFPKLQKLSREADPSVDISEFLTRVTRPLQKKENPADSLPVPVSHTDQGASLQARLEALKQQREIERKERERAMWRAASQPPRVTSPVPQSSPVENRQTGSAGRPEGAIPKLRSGKLL
jgi:hypothetical protein